MEGTWNFIHFKCAVNLKQLTQKVKSLTASATVVVSNVVKWLNEFHIKHETWVGSVVQGYQCIASWMSLRIPMHGALWNGLP